MALDDVGLRVDGRAHGVNAGDQIGSADVDGDGFVDLIVGARLAHDARGRVSVLRGPLLTPSTLDEPSFAIVGDQPGDVFGGAVGGVGDRDGDGIEEFLVGAKYAGGEGRAYLIDPARVSGVTTTNEAAATVFVGNGAMLLGGLAGDASGMLGGGEPLYWVSARDAAQGAGAVFFFDREGSGSRSVAQAEASLVGSQPGDALGAAVAGVADVDGDGIPDMVLCACSALGGQGEVRVVRGPLSAGHQGVPEEAVRITLEDSQGFIGAVAVADDVDGDGRADLVVGSRALASVWWTSAGQSSDLSEAPGHLLGPAGSELGQTVASLDLDGDGISDVIAGAPAFGDGGAVAIWYGPAKGERLEPDAWWVGPPGAHAGVALHLADLGGDGMMDVVVGGPGTDGHGAVWVVSSRP